MRNINFCHFSEAKLYFALIYKIFFIILITEFVSSSNGIKYYIFVICNSRYFLKWLKHNKQNVSHMTFEIIENSTLISAKYSIRISNFSLILCFSNAFWWHNARKGVEWCIYSFACKTEVIKLEVKVNSIFWAQILFLVFKQHKKTNLIQKYIAFFCNKNP